MQGAIKLMKLTYLMKKIELFILSLVVVISILLYRYIFPPTVVENVNSFRHDLFYSISELSDKARYVVRARIISVYDGADILGDTSISVITFRIYEIEILEVFYGETQIGNIMKTIQHTQNRQYNHGEIRRRNLRREVFVNYTSLDVGDDFILFLLPNELLEFHPINEDLTNETFISLQSSYYYTPEHLRNGQMNWVFVSVDKRNDLILTDAKLSNMSNTSNSR